MGEIADASAQREEHAGKERHLHRTTASISAAASTQSLDTCKRAVTRLMWMQLLHNSAALQAPPFGLCSNKQVIMLRYEGLGVPLGGSRGLGSVSQGL